MTRRKNRAAVKSVNACDLAKLAQKSFATFALSSGVIRGRSTEEWHRLPLSTHAVVQTWWTKDNFCQHRTSKLPCSTSIIHNRLCDYTFDSNNTRLNAGRVYVHIATVASLRLLRVEFRLAFGFSIRSFFQLSGHQPRESFNELLMGVSGCRLLQHEKVGAKIKDVHYKTTKSKRTMASPLQPFEAWGLVTITEEKNEIRNWPLFTKKMKWTGLVFTVR